MLLLFNRRYVRVLSASPSEEDADAGAAGGGGGMPTIMSAWESVCSAQNRRAADAARTAWRRCAEATEATLPQPPSALEATLSASRAAQLGAFDSSVSSAAAAAMLRATLGAEIDAAVVRLAAQNDELADVMCAKLLVTLHGTEGGEFVILFSLCCLTEYFTNVMLLLMHIICCRSSGED
tara:strand:- start:100 stop:639 length:540 start_codon:yes stop_codon:yes gene_type:complete